MDLGKKVRKGRFRGVVKVEVKGRERRDQRLMLTVEVEGKGAAEGRGGAGYTREGGKKKAQTCLIALVSLREARCFCFLGSDWSRAPPEVRTRSDAGIQKVRRSGHDCDDNERAAARRPFICY